jgi:hypothetical protein
MLLHLVHTVNDYPIVTPSNAHVLHKTSFLLLLLVGRDDNMYPRPVYPPGKNPNRSMGMGQNITLGFVSEEISYPSIRVGTGMRS